MLNLRELLSISNNESDFVFSNDTVIGHLHFSYRDTSIAGEFLNEVLNLDLKAEIPSAKFYADRNYHHHIAVNSWNKYYLKEYDENSTGIDFYEIIVTEDKLLQIKQNLKNKKINFNITEKSLKFKDFNGVKVILTKKYKK